MFRYDRMNLLAKEKGIKKAHICRKLDRSPYYLRDAEKTNIDISGAQLLLIANILGTSPEYLTGETDDPEIKKTPTVSGERNGLSDKAVEAATRFENADPWLQDQILALLRAAESNRAALDGDSTST